MPIYKPINTYEKVNLSKTLAYVFRDYIKKGMDEFPYNTDEVFLKNFKQAKEPNLYYYEIPKGYHVDRYSQQLESLIDYTNELIRKSNKFKDCKLDIEGNWTEGYIILLRKIPKSKVDDLTRMMKDTKDFKKYMKSKLI